jgi:NADPH-dependent curcumin reductase CurA
MMNRRWRLRQRPQGAASPADLELVEEALPELRDGEILVRNLYLSLDPTNRIWMSDREQYLPPVGIGDVMRGVTMGVVEASRSDRFAPGDFVSPGNGGWEDYTIARADWSSRVKRQDDVPLTAYMSVLGATGATAYFGMTEIGRPKEGETVVVSAAAGAVGSIAGQIARIAGARVIGICGGAAKGAQIVDQYGFDAAIDYRGEDVGAALDRLCPDGIDVDFENVGGPIMDAVYARMRNFGRIALCGMISTYDREGPIPGPPDFARILMRRLTIQGFVVVDYLSRMGQARAALSRWLAEGRLQWRAQVVDGLEAAPGALDMLFTGANDGKLLIRISDEP